MSPSSVLRRFVKHLSICASLILLAATMFSIGFVQGRKQERKAWQHEDDHLGGLLLAGLKMMGSSSDDVPCKTNKVQFSLSEGFFTASSNASVSSVVYSLWAIAHHRRWQKERGSQLVRMYLDETNNVYRKEVLSQSEVEKMKRSLEEERRRMRTLEPKAADASGPLSGVP